MKILLSIKPEYAEKILDGSKHYEFRKSVFKDQRVKSVVIYATMPVGKVVGEFDIDEVMHESPSSLWKKTKAHSGITKGFFEEYFLGREKAYAIKVKNPSRYKRPRELSRFLPNGIAPQSFCYLR